MVKLILFPRRRPALLLLVLAGSLSCGGDLNFDFPRPAQPLETTLYDLVAGPVDRPSGFDVVAGRGRGLPRSVRVDQSGEWDVAFALLDGQAVWLPRGFFESAKPSAGIVELNRAFDEILEAPADRELFERENPVPVSVGSVYVIRSRNDPALNLPCRLFAKLGVEAIEGDPVRVRFRYLWNPNCDQRNLTPAEEP